MIKKLIILTLGVFTMGFIDCGRGYFPVITEDFERYKVNKKILEYYDDDITIKVMGSTAFTHPRWSSIFEIQIINKGEDAVIIPYDSIKGRYENEYKGYNGKENIIEDMVKDIYKQHKEVNILEEPTWKISPHSKGEISVKFRLKEGGPYPDHVVILYIDEIKKAGSDEKFKFAGKFKI